MSDKLEDSHKTSRKTMHAIIKRNGKPLCILQAVEMYTCYMYQGATVHSLPE